jgi:hypothetical protein
MLPYTIADVGHCFGLPLTAYMRSGVTDAPNIVKKIISAIEGGKGLKTTVSLFWSAHLFSSLPPPPSQGLYKNNPSYVKVQTLQANLLVNPETPLDAEEPLVLAALLKRFFSELPDSLLTGDLYDRFIAGASLPTEDEQVDELDRVASQLPAAHQSVLLYLMKHLAKVALAQKTTKVDAVTLSDMWGGILVRPKDAEAAKAVADSTHQANAIRLLIARCKHGGASEVAAADSSGEVKDLGPCGSMPDPFNFPAPPLLPRKASTKRGSVPVAVQQSNYENIVLPRQPSIVRGVRSSFCPHPPPPKPQGKTSQAAAAQKIGGQAQADGQLVECRPVGPVAGGVPVVCRQHGPQRSRDCLDAFSR